jgi:predicted SnoaL-like aldol condensation-catalyzing enzyme
VWAIAALGLMPLHSVSAADKPEDAAVKSAQAWVSLVDQGKYAESWDAAAKLFQDAVPRDQWLQAIGAARTPLGKVLSRRLKSAEHKTSLPGAPDGKYVMVQFDTSFENKKAAVETVTPMQEANGTWRVSGYFVQ